MSSNKKFSVNKQELQNDLIKGKDNYPRTVAGVLTYLNFHSLNANDDRGGISNGSSIKKQETAMVNDEGHNSDLDKNPSHRSKTC